MKKLPIILLGTGIAFQLGHYFENRSLWLDETYVAANIMGQTWSELFHFNSIFSEQPQSPLIFYLIEKFNILILGNHEYAFRLWPLIAGILSIFFFYRITQRYLVGWPMYLALGLFVFCPFLIYYAAEVKHYSGDVLSTLFIYWLFEYIHERMDSRRALLFVGLIGGPLIWFSHVAIFPLAAIGIVLGWECLRRREWKVFLYLLLLGLFWTGNFLVLYNKSLGNILDSQYIMQTLEYEFMPQRGEVAKNILWLGSRMENVFRSLLGISFPLFASLLFGIGCLSMRRRDAKRFWVLFLTIIITLAAAILHRYPFEGRFLLFTVPAFILLISQGSSEIVRRVPIQWQVVTGFSLAGILLFAPLKTSL
ncbi:MAG: glycosyltransferase family 39 protein, partial [Candidatus Omnitrophica bacterium]|nr:glycosyltransferase family 39 protein [Candidatus Omnitrophota bacterium]